MNACIRKRERVAALLFFGAMLTVTGVHAQETETLPKQHAEKEYVIKLEDRREIRACYPTTSVEYQQHNDVAAVTGTISLDDCAKASGEYRVSVRIREESGELKNIDFTESWSRVDRAPVAIEREYPIGANVDLIRVRFRSKSCTCADADDATAP